MNNEQFINEYSGLVTNSICKEYGIDPNNINARAILAWNIHNNDKQLPLTGSIHSTCKCSTCGRSFETNIDDISKISALLQKQIILNMCDDCYTQYLLRMEDTK